MDDADASERDPAFISRVLPAVVSALSYFDPEVHGFERIPEPGPVLIVANHSGGIFMPDFWTFWSHWARERGPADPLYCLGFDLLFQVPPVARFVRRIGVVPASPERAARLLDEGCSVLVYPGGDEDAYRPWTERHRIDLRGRTGFVRLALAGRVPVVPLVSHGSHEALIVISRGEAAARRLGLRRLRVNILPVMVGPPWPLPAKVDLQVCEPLDWSRHGPAGADDPVVVRHCYEEILGRMQAALDDLVAGTPHPVMARLMDPARHGSRDRHDRV